MGQTTWPGPGGDSRGHRLGRLDARHGRAVHAVRPKGPPLVARGHRPARALLRLWHGGARLVRLGRPRAHPLCRLGPRPRPEDGAGGRCPRPSRPRGGPAPGTAQPAGGGGGRTFLSRLDLTRGSAGILRDAFARSVSSEAFEPFVGNEQLCGGSFSTSTDVAATCDLVARLAADGLFDPLAYADLLRAALARQRGDARFRRVPPRRGGGVPLPRAEDGGPLERGRCRGRGARGPGAGALPQGGRVRRCPGGGVRAGALARGGPAPRRHLAVPQPPGGRDHGPAPGGHPVVPRRRHSCATCARTGCSPR